jgi:uncharacterized protein
MVSEPGWLSSAIRAEVARHLPPGAAVFDVHAHTGADVDGSMRSACDHVADIAPLGGRSAIFPLCVTTGYAAENRRVLAECAAHRDLLVPFARLDPRADGVGMHARAALAAGARGLKLHPRAEAFGIGHPGVYDILAVASEARVPVVVHAGLGVGSFGAPLLELARAHPRAAIVLAHAGISDLAWLWRHLDEQPNLFFDTAWWNPADLLALFARVPADRILWGSDAPYGDVSLGLAVTLRCARWSGLDDDALRLVVGDRLRRLLDGELVVDAAPPPRRVGRLPSISEAQSVSWLTGVGGCLLGGGDPDPLLPLARIATDDAAVSALLDVVAERGAAARSALILALAIAATPGVDVAAEPGANVLAA